MNITISLMSNEQGEIKKFLDTYFEKETEVEDNVIEWIYVYRNANKALDMMDVTLDNLDDYRLSLWIQIEDDDIIEVNKNNRAKITTKVLSTMKTSMCF